MTNCMAGILRAARRNVLSRVLRFIDLVEFLYFIIPTDIGLHYTDGGQVFLDDPEVDQIDGALHHAVEGPHMADDGNSRMPSTGAATRTPGPTSD